MIVTTERELRIFDVLNLEAFEPIVLSFKRQKKEIDGVLVLKVRAFIDDYTRKASAKKILDSVIDNLHDKQRKKI